MTERPQNNINPLELISQQVELSTFENIYQEKLNNIHQPELWGFEVAEQDCCFFEDLPYSDFRRWVPENSIYDKALINIHSLNRLSEVKCLSFLSYVGPNPQNIYFTPFTHSRFDHSLTVALIIEQILKQNGLPQDQVDLGIIAGILHDIATPAYGDATKQIDMENLHEEDYWWEVLDEKERDFVTQFGTREEIDKIIKNQGLLGKVLDVSDRIVYTMKDLNALIWPNQIEKQEENDYLLEIKKIVNNNLKIGNIYKEVGVDQKKQEVVFNNPRNLNIFLNLRAHLHRNLYLHPINQAKDLFVAKVIGQVYSRNKDSFLSADKLREMTDHDLLSALGTHYKESAVTMHPLLVNWQAEFEKFDSLEEAKIKENKLKQNKNIAIVGIKEIRDFNSMTDCKITDGYKYVKFKKYNSQAAKKIEKISQSTKGIFLFWTDISEKTSSNKFLADILSRES
jgi:HD superfamily phosphohydrolase